MVGYKTIKPVPEDLRGREGGSIQKLGKPQTRPGPVDCPIYQVRTHGILQHIANDREKMRVLLNRKTLEAALPDMAMTVVVPMVAPYVAGHPPLHKGADCSPTGWLEDEVEMIGHQAEGKNVNGMSGFSRSEEVHEGPIIPICIKHRGAAIASIEDMEGMTGEVPSWNARHGREGPREWGVRHEKSSLSPLSALYPYPYLKGFLLCGHSFTISNHFHTTQYSIGAAQRNSHLCNEVTLFDFLVTPNIEGFPHTITFK